MAAEREIAAEDSIKVVCRFRPLNDSEEKAGSKFIVKFPTGPDENCITIGVSTSYSNLYVIVSTSILCWTVEQHTNFNIFSTVSSVLQLMV